MIALVPWQVFGRYEPKDKSFYNHCQLIPLVHQIVGNPDASHEFPERPRTQADHLVAMQYWDAAYYYLTVILGWADPGLGLLWYFNNDRQDFGEYRLQVLKQVWDSDGQLDLLAAWLWRYQGSTIREMQLGRLLRLDSIPPPMELHLGDWWVRFEKKYRPHQSEVPPNPYFGGTNPLHLGHFDFVFKATASPGQFLLSDPSTRTACLIVENGHGWYAALQRHGQALPKLGSQSWHVEVFAKTVGYLGLFRQSRETGLWFVGKHSLHSVGNSHKLG